MKPEAKEYLEKARKDAEKFGALPNPQSKNLLQKIFGSNAKQKSEAVKSELEEEAVATIALAQQMMEFANQGTGNEKGYIDPNLIIPKIKIDSASQALKDGRAHDVGEERGPEDSFNEAIADAKYAIESINIFKNPSHDKSLLENLRANVSRSDLDFEPTITEPVEPTKPSFLRMPGPPGFPPPRPALSSLPPPPGMKPEPPKYPPVKKSLGPLSPSPPLSAGPPPDARGREDGTKPRDSEASAVKPEAKEYLEKAREAAEQFGALPKPDSKSSSQKVLNPEGKPVMNELEEEAVATISLAQQMEEFVTANQGTGNKKGYKDYLTIAGIRIIQASYALEDGRKPDVVEGRGPEASFKEAIAYAKYAIESINVLQNPSHDISLLVELEESFGSSPDFEPGTNMSSSDHSGMPPPPPIPKPTILEVGPNVPRENLAHNENESLRDTLYKQAKSQFESMGDKLKNYPRLEKVKLTFLALSPDDHGDNLQDAIKECLSDKKSFSPIDVEAQSGVLLEVCKAMVNLYYFLKVALSDDDPLLQETNEVMRNAGEEYAKVKKIEEAPKGTPLTEVDTDTVPIVEANLETGVIELHETNQVGSELETDLQQPTASDTDTEDAKRMLPSGPPPTHEQRSVASFYDSDDSDGPLPPPPRNEMLKVDTDTAPIVGANLETSVIEPTKTNATERHPNLLSHPSTVAGRYLDLLGPTLKKHLEDNGKGNREFNIEYMYRDDAHYDMFRKNLDENFKLFLKEFADYFIDPKVQDADKSKRLKDSFDRILEGGIYEAIDLNAAGLDDNTKIMLKDIAAKELLTVANKAYDQTTLQSINIEEINGAISLQQIILANSLLNSSDRVESGGEGYCGDCSIIQSMREAIRSKTISLESIDAKLHNILGPRGTVGKEEAIILEDAMLFRSLYVEHLDSKVPQTRDVGVIGDKKNIYWLAEQDMHDIAKWLNININVVQNVKRGEDERDTLLPFKPDGEAYCTINIFNQARIDEGGIHYQALLPKSRLSSINSSVEESTESDGDVMEIEDIPYELYEERVSSNKEPPVSADFNEKGADEVLSRDAELKRAKGVLFTAEQRRDDEAAKTNRLTPKQLAAVATLQPRTTGKAQDPNNKASGKTKKPEEYQAKTSKNAQTPESLRTQNPSLFADLNKTLQQRKEEQVAKAQAAALGVPENVTSSTQPLLQKTAQTPQDEKPANTSNNNPSRFKGFTAPATESMGAPLANAQTQAQTQAPEPQAAAVDVGVTRSTEGLVAKVKSSIDGQKDKSLYTYNLRDEGGIDLKQNNSDETCAIVVDNYDAKTPDKIGTFRAPGITEEKTRLFVMATLDRIKKLSEADNSNIYKLSFKHYTTQEQLIGLTKALFEYSKVEALNNIHIENADSADFKHKLYEFLDNLENTKIYADPKDAGKDVDCKAFIKELLKGKPSVSLSHASAVAKLHTRPPRTEPKLSFLPLCGLLNQDVYTPKDNSIFGRIKGSFVADPNNRPIKPPHP